MNTYFDSSTSPTLPPRTAIRLSGILAASSAALLLAGCGGGGSGSSTTGGGGGGGGGGGTTPPAGVPSAQGLYVGSTKDGRALEGFVLDNGNYWFVYSTPGAAQVNPSTVAGAVQGIGNTTGTTFSSSSAKDFSLQYNMILNTRVGATFSAKSSLNGELTYTDGSIVTFQSQYDSRFDLTPDVIRLAGTYVGPAVAADAQGVATDSAMVTIASSGSINGSTTAGCAFTGSVSAHASGNIYDVTITFGGGACANGTNTVKGIAFLDPSTKQLFSAAVNGVRDNGFLFLGNQAG